MNITLPTTGSYKLKETVRAYVTKAMPKMTKYPAYARVCNGKVSYSGTKVWSNRFYDKQIRRRFNYDIKRDFDRFANTYFKAGWQSAIAAMKQDVITYNS